MVLARQSLLAALLFAAGCADIPFEERGKITQAVFDPSTSDIPTPNNLAMKDGVIEIAENPLLSATENAVKMQLNGRGGFSNGSSSRVRFTEQLSAASISAETVFAIDLGENGKGPPTRLDLPATYSECDASLSFASPTGLLPGHTYLFAIRGGEAGVKDSQGKPIAAMPAFHLLRAGQDLREHLDAIPGKTRAEKQAAAEKLEGIRQSYEPYFQVLESNGLPRREVAVLWSFTTTRDGEVYFDPASKKIPFPNDLLKDPATGLVSVPVSPTDSDSSKMLKAGLSKLDGFSVTAAHSLESSTAIDRTTVVAGKTVRLFATLPDGTAQEKKDISATVSPDGKKLTVQPLSPLLPGTPYSLIVAGVKDVNAKVLATMPLQQLLASEHPLVDEDGKSLISSLCADTAKRLEPLRQHIAPALAAIGDARAQLSAAYTFTTQDILKRAQEAWRAPYEANLTLSLTNVESGSPWDRGYGITMPSIAKIITGRMTTLDYLDPITRGYRASGVGVPREIEFVLTIPTGLQQGAKVPVVVFGHGLMTERRLSLTVAQRIAMRGMATIAIDFPYHGERTVCVEDADCSGGAACNKDGTCAGGADLSRAPSANWFFDLVNLKGNGKGTPTATGKAFIDVPNLFGSRDHFRQAFVDLSALTRLVREKDWTTVTGGFDLDGDTMHYVGISLGGIIGGSVGGIDPYYSKMLLNVPGAGLPLLMKESTFFGPQLKTGLAEKGILEGTPEEEAFVNAAKWVLDEIDPVNLSAYAMKRPLVWTDPKTGQQQTAPPKSLRIQMAIGDGIVPNSSTERLRDAALTNPTTQFVKWVDALNHGMLGNPVGAPQADMADFLGGN